MSKEPKKKKETKTFYSIKGLVELSIGIALLLSLFSFLSHWEADQSQLGYLFDRKAPAKNLLGKIGAEISHCLIYKGIGVTSFLLPIIFIFFGFKTIFIKSIKLKKIFSHFLFFSFWLPPFLSFIFYKNSILGGIYGFEIKEILISLIGRVGLSMLFAMIILLYLISVFKISAEEIKRFFLFFVKKAKTSSSISSNEDFSQSAEMLEKPKKEFDFSTTSNEIQKEEKNQMEQKKIQKNQDNTSSLIKLSVEEKKEEHIPKKIKAQENAESKKNKNSFFPTPPLDILSFSDHSSEIAINQKELEANKNKIVETLNHYKIGIDKIKATIGPSVTLYEIIPEAGIRISRIKNLEDDIALSLAALGIRIIAPIPGKGTIGIEVPNSKPSLVYIKTVLASECFQNSDMDLPLVLGKSISNETILADLSKLPHLLIAGATGQGKSVGLNVIITSLLYKKRPQDLKFVMIDPKKVELSIYKKIERYYMAKLPHAKESIITDTTQAKDALNSLCKEMDRRYELLKNTFVRNIKEYNEKILEGPKEHLPYIVLVVDEFADLIMTAGRDIEVYIARLAQLARAVGIHLIIATQRPSVNVITGLIKANFPARIAFRVSSKVDSRTILDAAGADQLIGRGDMLFSNGNELIRLQCPFISTKDIENIIDFYEKNKENIKMEAFELPEPDKNKEGDKSDFSGSSQDLDPLFEEAARLVITTGQGSTSIIQRKLAIGYNRAARIVDQLEGNGILGPFEGSKARQILVADEGHLNKILNERKVL